MTESSLSVRQRGTVGTLSLDVAFDLIAPWTVLFGASGSGKSTILRGICGLISFAEQHVELNGTDITYVPTHKRRIGLVQQQPALFPNMTVRQNVVFGCTEDPGCNDSIQEILGLFDLEKLRDARTTRLSGGERQRVAIARTLAAAPRLLLLDEVFTGMHRSQRDLLQARVAEHCRVRRKPFVPVLSVTHDIAEALQADEIIKLEDGHVVAQGPPASVLATEREALLLQLTMAGKTTRAAVRST
jgi:molybdate transport system ATP-binding protein